MNPKIPRRRKPSKQRTARRLRCLHLFVFLPASNDPLLLGARLPKAGGNAVKAAWPVNPTRSQTTTTDAPTNSNGRSKARCPPIPAVTGPSVRRTIKSSHGCPPNHVRTCHGARWASIGYDLLFSVFFAVPPLPLRALAAMGSRPLRDVHRSEPIDRRRDSGRSDNPALHQLREGVGILRALHDQHLRVPSNRPARYES